MSVAPSFQSTILGQKKALKTKVEVKNGNNKRRKKTTKRKN
jgi:hypothetical protein